MVVRAASDWRGLYVSPCMPDAYESTPVGLSAPLGALELAEVDSAERSSGLPARASFTLSGELAMSAAQTLARAAIDAKGSAGAQASEVMYRLVVTDPKLREGLAKGTLRFASPSQGDASVLIKHVASGRVAGAARLVKGGSTTGTAVGVAGTAGTAAVIAPIVVVAVAMAVIMYQLKTIDSKLDAMARDLRSVLDHLQTDRQSVLRQGADAARSALATVSAGGTVSEARAQELHRAVQRIETVWLAMYSEAASAARAYRDGVAGGSADDAVDAWMRLLLATRAHCETAEALMRVPRTSANEFELVVVEEQERLTRRLETVRELAEELRDGHLYWREQRTAYDFSRTLNPAKLAKRAVTRQSPAKPRRKPLPDRVAWQCDQLAAPPAPPEAILLVVRGDGSLRVAVESRELEVGA